MTTYPNPYLNHYLSYGSYPEKLRHTRIGLRKDVISIPIWRKITTINNWSRLDLRNFAVRTDFVRLKDAEVVFANEKESKALEDYYAKKKRFICVGTFIIRDNNSAFFYFYLLLSSMSRYEVLCDTDSSMVVKVFYDGPRSVRWEILEHCCEESRVFCENLKKAQKCIEYIKETIDYAYDEFIQDYLQDNADGKLEKSLSFYQFGTYVCCGYDYNIDVEYNMSIDLPMIVHRWTELFRLCKRQMIAGKRVLLIKYSEDTRYDIDKVTTHDSVNMDAVNSLNLLPLYAKALYYDCIGIDEGQFFQDIVPFADSLADSGKLVYVAALDSNFQKEPFPNIAYLLAKAEEAHKLNAICICCGKTAAFSYRDSESTEIEIIGGLELYKPLCRNCFNNCYKK
uniref:Thymidine kinase, cytosolic n=1 Tax=Panagrolaimus davidi TaxID=227884 RepID=A0A914QRC2_9BILA